MTEPEPKVPTEDEDELTPAEGHAYQDATRRLFQAAFLDTD